MKKRKFYLSKILISIIFLMSLKSILASPTINYEEIPFSPSTNCNADKVLKTLTSMSKVSPLDLLVRGKTSRIPFRAEDNKNVGSWGWTRKFRNGKPKFHAGTDLLADEGEDVLSVFEGEVFVAEDSTIRNGEFGKYVWLKINVPIVPGFCEIALIYAHLSKISVKAKDKVMPGSKIGEVGRTGNLSDKIPTHLHIEMWMGKYDKEKKPSRTRDVMTLF